MMLPGMVTGSREAMKMKQLVPSPVAGVVKEYKVQPGDRVSAGQVIAVVE